MRRLLPALCADQRHAEAMTGPDISWFAVRCVFAVGWLPEVKGKTYEERITLWRAASAEEAMQRAEAEAEGYAATIEEAPSKYLGLAQAYRLDDEPVDGAEIYSLMRDSALSHDRYLNRFFDTGAERQGSTTHTS